MSAATANVIAPGAMYVRALYDYDADDRTSLSFRQGDIIQVITQLESGWWDGVIYGVRGWFPSNYCAVITGTEATQGPHAMQDQAGDSESEDAYANSGLGIATPGFDGVESKLHLDTDIVQEEAAFWIPQATPDGRLFYFNTLTGVSTMELPLETPTSATDYRSKDAAGMDPRPAAEMLAGGLEREELQAEYDNRPQSRSHLANGASPLLTSSSSFMAPSSRGRSAGNDTIFSVTVPQSSVSTAFSRNPLGVVTSGITSRSLFADATHAFPSTWDSLVENMRRCVQYYKAAIEHGDRAEFVKRAEDISDHLRNLLAAGSGTTDNHSGNPSIISTNKTLYPHFREMMSSFSKLVLSSHFAAADFTSPDSYTKCLQEADGLLRGTDGFVAVARQQRGEELPRLTPGFFVGTRSGGHWRNQGLNIRDASFDLPLVRDQNDVLAEPNIPLDATLLERMEDLKKLIIASIRRLDEHLVLRDTLITPSKHLEMGDNVCKEAGRVLELCRPYITIVETVNLSPFGNDMNTAQLEDFATHKQRFYDATSEVVVSCQAVASPLGDEWSSERGPSMEERLENVRLCSRGLERATSQLQYSIQLLAEILPADPGRMSIDSRRTAYEGRGGYQEVLRNRGINTGVGTPRSFSEASENMSPAQSQKIHRFFGEVPIPLSQTTTNETVIAEEKTPFLGLDHENEIAYDIKTTPPQLRGGTLVGLVEQLTRHDKLDSSFNNTFLLTYRSFTTASDLFEMLVNRWCIQPPQNLGPLDIQRWIDKKQKPIRFRVVNILKSWFDSYWMEGTDENAQQLMQRVFTFAKETVASTSTPGAGPLMTAIEQRMRGQDASSKRMILTHSGSMPAAIVPKNIKKLKFLDIDTLEFARQLTIIESRLYHKIKSTECLNKTWQKKLGEGEADPASNVKALILHSNQLTNWVAQMILTQADVKRRQIVIKHFVSIADKCRAMNNFSTLTSIISALGTAPIHRLGRTWSQVNQKTMASLETMRALMGSTKNFLEYRETLHKANPPCIPFFGVYLTDLTFIEDGIPSIIKKTSLINFAKRAKTAEVIRDIQQFQNVPYQLQAVAELQDYILKNMQTAGDVHEMYERSLQVEPREREDEKIARLLSESGFL